MAYKTSIVANQLIQMAWDEGQVMTPRRVQRLLTFSHGFCLSIYDEPLVKELIELENVSGLLSPIFPKLQKKFVMEVKNWFVSPIGQLIPVNMWDKDFDTASKYGKLLYKVWEVYKNISSVKLSNIVFSNEFTPRTEAIRLGYDHIPNQLLKEYFDKVRGNAVDPE